MSEYQDYVDSLIVKALKEDDRKALNQIFEFYYNKLLHIGLRWTKDIALTEDCLQEVFLDLWNYRKTLGNFISLENYLKVSLRRRIYKKLQKNDALRIWSELDPDHSPPALTSESYEYNLIQMQTNEHIKQSLVKAINTLSPKQRDIIYFKYFEEMTYQEIADKTGVEPNTLYKLLHDAVKKLKNIFDKK